MFDASRIGGPEGLGGSRVMHRDMLTGSWTSTGAGKMRVIDFSRSRAQPIELFGSVAASSVRMGDGMGEVHVYCVHFGPGGSIGEHPTGFGQLFLVMDGSGWVVGADGSRVAIGAGQAAFFEKGERHSKGSEGGMTALMVQVADLQVPENGP
jgi:quercetin dioxygenase-like cupin family protein